MKSRGFATRAVHGPTAGRDANRALRFPIYAGAAFDFGSAESMAECFSGRKAGYAYSRIANPTVDAFERTVTSLEGGLAAVAVSSGMAALSAALLNLLSAGDNLLSVSSLFGGTYSLLRNVLQPLGIETRFVPADDVRAMEEAIDGRTRAIFLETISNPCMIVPDIGRIAAVARERKIVVIADSTVTTPYLFQAGAFGVNLVVHSTTKYFSGGSTSMGGIVVDLGNFDWAAVPSLNNYHRFGEWAFIARLRKEVYRETGSCLSPHHAYLQTLGLETLSLRMEKLCGNAQRIAEYLDGHAAVRSVLFPGLSSSPYYAIAGRQFRGRFGGILSFNLSDREACFRFLNGLSLVCRASNLGDNKSLALHAASTIFAGIPPDELKNLGVDDTLIRLSVGIEEVEDLLEDIGGALEGRGR